MSASLTLPHNVLFLYLGRRGALGRFALELIQAAHEMPDLRSTIALSAMNESISEFAWLGKSLLTLNMFNTAVSPAIVRTFFASRRRLLRQIRDDKVSAVVTLMPHIWTPLLVHPIQSLGVKYVTIVHDAVGHPGDLTGLVVPWLRREARSADLVVTLSQAVSRRLLKLDCVRADKLLPLFHPDLHYLAHPFGRQWTGSTPLRLLFLGRIQKYKGLPLLLEALELLRAEGVRAELCVAGAGDIGSLQDRLTALQVEVINRWLSDHEIAALLTRHHAMALPYVEASQSGVAASAFGSFMPVVATPTGGLAEQVINERTGVLATAQTARSLANAIARLATDPGLYGKIVTYLRDTSSGRSMQTFLQCIATRLG